MTQPEIIQRAQGYANQSGESYRVYRRAESWMIVHQESAADTTGWRYVQQVDPYEHP